MTEGASGTGRGIWWDLVIFLFCLGIGGTFLYASLNKIVDPAGFARAIHNYRLLPLPLLHPVALYLPWLEAVVGCALILGIGRRGASLLALLMTLMFVVAITAALVRHLDISCGCFHTGGEDVLGTGLLIRDILLLAACLVPLLSRRSGWAILPALWGKRVSRLSG